MRIQVLLALAFLAVSLGELDPALAEPETREAEILFEGAYQMWFAARAGEPAPPPGTCSLYAVREGEAIRVEETVAARLAGGEVTLSSSVICDAGGAPLGGTAAATVDGRACLTAKAEIRGGALRVESLQAADAEGNPLPAARVENGRQRRLPPGLSVFRSAIPIVAPLLLPAAGELRDVVVIEFPDDVDSAVNVKEKNRLVREAAQDGGFAVHLYDAFRDFPIFTVRYGADGRITEMSSENATFVAMEGTAGRQPPDGDRPPTADDRPLTTDDRRPTADDQPLTTDDGPPSTDERPRTTDEIAAPSTPPSPPVPPPELPPLPPRDPAADDRPLTTDDRPLTTDDGPPTTDDGPPTTDDGPPTTGDGPPTTEEVLLDETFAPASSKGEIRLRAVRSGEEVTVEETSAVETQGKALVLHTVVAYTLGDPPLPRSGKAETSVDGTPAMTAEVAVAEGGSTFKVEILLGPDGAPLEKPRTKASRRSLPAGPVIFASAFPVLAKEFVKEPGELGNAVLVKFQGDLRAPVDGKKNFRFVREPPDPQGGFAIHLFKGIEKKPFETVRFGPDGGISEIVRGGVAYRPVVGAAAPGPAPGPAPAPAPEAPQPPETPPGTGP